MLRGIYTAASGMLADQRRLDVIANNLANSSTAGYKRDTSVRQSFTDFLVVRLNDPDNVGDTQNPQIGRLGFGTLLAFTATKITTGNMVQTGNSLDVAIEGDGFFTVQTPQGIRYTRDGAFLQDSQGRLVTKQGHQVLVDGRAVRAEVGTLAINNLGQVLSGETILGTLSIATSDQLGSIRKEGAGLWLPVSEGEPTTLFAPWETTGKYRLRSGFLESSNVEAVTEMVEMMTTVRSYEVNQKAVQAQDEALQKVTAEVGRIG